MIVARNVSSALFARPRTSAKVAVAVLCEFTERAEEALVLFALGEAQRRAIRLAQQLVQLLLPLLRLAGRRAL